MKVPYHLSSSSSAESGSRYGKVGRPQQICNKQGEEKMMTKSKEAKFRRSYSPWWLAQFDRQRTRLIKLKAALRSDDQDYGFVAVYLLIHILKSGG